MRKYTTDKKQGDIVIGAYTNAAKVDAFAAVGASSNDS